MPGNDRLFQLLGELDDAELKNIWTTCLGKTPEDEYFERRHPNPVMLMLSEPRR
jgi:hypothetical protein